MYVSNYVLEKRAQVLYKQNEELQTDNVFIPNIKDGLVTKKKDGSDKPEPK